MYLETGKVIENDFFNKRKRISFISHRPRGAATRCDCDIACANPGHGIVRQGKSRQVLEDHLFKK